MSNPPNSDERRRFVESLVHTWRGRLSPQTQRALSTYDVDALEAMVFAAIEVILARRGSIPGLTHAMDQGFASMRQDLDPSVLEGLRDLEMRVPQADPPAGVNHAQVSPSVVADLLDRAVDLIGQQMETIATLKAQVGET